MTATNYSEPELLSLISTGDQSAFTILFNQNWDKLYHYVLRIAKRPEFTEEICQDVFMKIWKRREYAQSIQNFDSFLKIVARNKAIDFLRAAANHELLRASIDDVMLSASDQSADSLLLSHELRKMLEEALAQLSPQRRVIFTLHKVEGLSNEEIAILLGLSRQTVKNTMTEASKAVQRYLSQKPGSALLSLLLFSQMN